MINIVDLLRNPPHAHAGTAGTRLDPYVVPKIMRDAADEIVRLRAVLESLTKDPPATLDEPDEDWEVVVKMRAIARAALAQNGAGTQETK